MNGAGNVLWAAPNRPPVSPPDAAVILFASGSSGQRGLSRMARCHLEQHLRNVIETRGVRGPRDQVIFVPSLTRSRRWLSSCPGWSAA